MAERRPIWRVDAGGVDGAALDDMAHEAPLVIRARGTQVVTLLRTPGADLELVAGLLHAEGLPRASAVSLGHDVVDVDLDPARFVARPLVATGSCGACSQAIIKDLQWAHGLGSCATPASPKNARPAAQVPAPPALSCAIIAALPDRLRAAQAEFAATGGLHAAALFDGHGALLAAREDIGRHNAVDKVIGWAVRGGRALPLADAILMLSGRVGFELVAKAHAAGIPCVAAISAPTSLAVDAAVRCGITLCGFVRDGQFNVYAHPERLGARS